MDKFNEKIIFYGDLILSQEIIKNLRCELTINHLNTDYNIAEISLLSSIHFQSMNQLNTHKKIVFKTENQSKSIYLESVRYHMHDQFTWEASLILFPYRVEIKDIYSDQEIKKIIFRAFISPSELLFNERIITFHEARGLLSGWNQITTTGKTAWLEDNFNYQSEIGPIELIPGFAFKELKDDKNR